jgi:hypothetical protein
MKKNGVNMVSERIKRKSTKIQYEHDSDGDYNDSDGDYNDSDEKIKNDEQNNKNNTKPNKRGKPNSVSNASTDSTHLTRKSTRPSD